MTEHTHTHSNCKSLLGTLSDYVDGELEAELCREIEKHIAECENCRIVVDTTRRTIDLVHASNSAESGLPNEVRDRLFKRLDLTDYLKPQAK
jgi:anti-sigma factor (TIGR02949 family)